jgi:hypothetical protein
LDVLLIRLGVALGGLCPSFGGSIGAMAWWSGAVEAAKAVLQLGALATATAGVLLSNKTLCELTRCRSETPLRTVQEWGLEAARRLCAAGPVTAEAFLPPPDSLAALPFHFMVHFLERVWGYAGHAVERAGYGPRPTDGFMAVVLVTHEIFAFLWPFASQTRYVTAVFTGALAGLWAMAKQPFLPLFLAAVAGERFMDDVVVKLGTSGHRAAESLHGGPLAGAGAVLGMRVPLSVAGAASAPCQDWLKPLSIFAPAGSPVVGQLGRVDLDWVRCCRRALWCSRLPLSHVLPSHSSAGVADAYSCQWAPENWLVTCNVGAMVFGRAQAWGRALASLSPSALWFPCL